MDRSNLVVLRGRLSSEPRVRSLPSGSTLTQLELTTRTDSGVASVPVVVFDVVVRAAADDEVVVVGHVRRRFFRAGAATQSRTEVVAERVVPAARRRRVERAVDAAVRALTAVSAASTSRG